MLTMKELSWYGSCTVWSLVWITYLSGVQGQLPSWKRKPDNASVLLGENVTFYCEMDNAPVDNTVIWSRVVGSLPKILFMRGGGSNIDVPERYSIVGQYNLVITGVQRQDAGVFTCEWFRLSTETAILDVLVPPGPPTIDIIGPPGETEPYKEGMTISIHCTTSGGNPVPTIHWFRNGIEESTFSSQQSGDALISTLKRTLTYDDHNAVYRCDVFNKVNVESPLNATKVLNVEFSPRVSFRPYDPLDALEGTNSYVECVVDANPPPSSIQWTKDGNNLIASANLSFPSVSRTDAGDYKCEATNSIGQGSKTIKIDVLYKPTVTLPNSLMTFKENENISIKCEYTANPAPSPEEIRWYELKSKTHIQNGETLTIKKIDRNQAGIYSCNVTNQLKPSASAWSLGTGSAEVEIVVQYKPGPAKIKPIGRVKMGDTTTLTCYIEDKDQGIPPASFRWVKDGNILAQKAVYTKPNTQLSDIGNYKCIPYNSIGDGEAAERYLDVGEPPELLQKLDESQTFNIDDQRGSLMCQARGRPEPMIHWFKDGIEITADRSLYSVAISQSTIDTNSFSKTSTLSFKGTSRPGSSPLAPSPQLMVTDTGNYTCEARNIYGNIAGWGEIIINYPAIMEAAAVKIGANIEENITMRCKAKAEPAPTFQWFVKGALLSPVDGKILVKALGEQGESFVSELLLMNVQEADYGIYQCTASNTLGNGHTNFTLGAKTPPEVPHSIVVKVVTWESVHIEWEPGFDGGYPQSFVIQCGTKTVSVPGKIPAYNMTGLNPESTYTFRIQGLNQLGPGPWCPPVEVRTPGVDMPNPTDVNYDQGEKFVTYTVKGSSRGYCLRVDISTDDSNWENYVECAAINQMININTDKHISHVNVSMCFHHRRDVCGPQVKAKIIEVEEDISMQTIIIVACVCGTVVLVLLVILLIICCRRQKKEKDYPEAANRRPNPVPLTGSKRGRSRPGPGIDNPALDVLDAGDMDDPTAGAPHMNGGPPNLYARQNGHLPSDPPPSYEMDNFSKGPFTITITDPEKFDSLEKKPVLHLNSDPDRPPYGLHPNGSFKYDDSRSHNESGYSTPDPTKPKKVIYEVIV